MTSNDIKELVSRNQFKTIANRSGFKCEKPGDGDHGVDFHVHEVQTIHRPQGPRVFDTGKVLPFQLKATTEKSIDVANGFVKFDLEAKTYNDLVDRQGSPYPLTLILAVLPPDESLWVKCHDDSIVQLTKLYWYRPPPNSVLTSNDQKKRVSVPISNRIDLDFLSGQFVELFQ